MTCYIEKPTEYGADQIEFDSGALISREFDKLSWQRQKAVIQLFQGKTLKEISQDVGVHLNTIENWKKDEKFQKARTEYSLMCHHRNMII